MWDRPDILNRIANGLFALATLLTVLCARYAFVVKLPGFCVA